MARVPEVLWRRREGLTQIVVVVAAIQVYETFRRVIHPDWPAAMDNAQRVVHLERYLGMAWEHSLQRAFLGLPELIEAMNLFYFVGHFLLTGIFFFWLYHRSRKGFKSFRNGFLIATAIALVIHWEFPTAPPRLAGMGFVDTLRQFSDIDIGSDRASSYYNPVAAVPSLHAGYAVGVGIGLIRFSRLGLVRLLGLVYPMLVVLTIVVTGNHFLIDAVAGVGVLAAGFLLARLLSSRRPRRKPPAILRAATRGGAVR